MTLRKYAKRKVVLTDINKVQWHGTVTTVTPKIESANGETEVGLMTNDGLIIFGASKISTISEM
jgi:hypothetical protein